MTVQIVRNVSKDPRKAAHELGSSDHTFGQQTNAHSDEMVDGWKGRVLLKGRVEARPSHFQSPQKVVSQNHDVVFLRNDELEQLEDENLH